jgi:hypothetical protein
METRPIKAMNKMATMKLKYWTWEKLTKNTESYKTAEELQEIPADEKYGAYKPVDPERKLRTIPYYYVNTKAKMLEWIDDLIYDRYEMADQLDLDLESEVAYMDDMMQESLGESLEDMGLEDQAEASILQPIQDELRDIKKAIEEMD